MKLWVRSASGGGEPTQIAPGCRLFESTPVWSPDGRHVFFIGICGSDVLAWQSRPEHFGIAAWVANVDGSGLKQNREFYHIWQSIHYEDPIIDQWIANPSRLLIPLLVGDAVSVTSVPVSADGTEVSGPPQRLAFVGGTDARISAAQNGRIVLSAGDARYHIWTLPLGSNGAAKGPPRQVTHGPAGERSPALSSDQRGLAFLARRESGTRLFYKDLTTGREKELSTAGYRYEAPVFSPDGTRIMCVQYPSPASFRDVVYEVPVSGGPSKTIWDKSVWSWVSDWFPDGSRLLLSGGSLAELDLASGVRTALLNNGQELHDAHYSHDGRWLVFRSAPPRQTLGKFQRSEVFVAPYRGSVASDRELIRVAANNIDYDPHFSADDRLIFFMSERDGFPCIWAQPMAANMHPEGRPFAVYHSHERRRTLAGMDVGSEVIAFARNEVSGNVWLLESK